MPEDCKSVDCSVAVRLDALKEEFNTYRTNSSATHKEIYNRLGNLEKVEAAQEEYFKTVNEKLDTLISWQKNQQDKPAKRWDSIVEKVIWAICAAVIAFLLGRVGL